MVSKKTLKHCCLLLCLLRSCKDHKDQKAEKFHYELVQRDAGGVEVKPGQYLKLAVTQTFGDTVLRSPSTTGYEYQLVDSMQMSKESWAAFKHATIGDSMVFRLHSDSAFKQTKPAFIKHPGYLVTSIRVISILANVDSARADLERERHERKF